MCCEMEGAAIAQTCYLNSTPFVVIRAISDKPDETEIVEYKVFEEQAAQRCAKIVRYMVERGCSSAVSFCVIIKSPVFSQNGKTGHYC